MFLPASDIPFLPPSPHVHFTSTDRAYDADSTLLRWTGFLHDWQLHGAAEFLPITFHSPYSDLSPNSVPCEY